MLKHCHCMFSDGSISTLRVNTSLNILKLFEKSEPRPACSRVALDSYYNCEI